MSLTKQQLRDFVRAQLDVDEEELTNSQLDLFLGEAFQRTVAVERKWPFLEQEWELQFLAGAPITFPNDLASIQSIYMYNVDQLRFIDHGFAEEQFGRDGTVGTTRFYSLRNQRIYPWPAPFVDAEILVTGWRKPIEYYAAAAGTAPDCDSRLHSALVWYACALAQSMNEEDVYDSIYYKKWQDVAQSARDDIMRPAPGRARVLNGGIAKLKGRFSHWTVT